MSAPTTATDERGPDRRDRQQQARGDSGEREMADAVAHQRQVALHEERADERGARADDDTDGERELHVLTVEGPGEREGSLELLQPSGRSSAWMPRLTPRAARSRGGPSKSTRCLSTITRSRSAATAPSSCETSSTVVECSRTRWTSELRNSRCDSASTPAIGSSRIRSSGSRDERPRDQRPLLLAAGELGDQAPARSSARATASSAWVDGCVIGRASAGATRPRRASRPPATTSATVAGSSGARRLRCGT